MRIFALTSDMYLPALKPFMFLFNVFWSHSQRVTILGYKEPDFKLKHNFEFVSMGQDTGPETWSVGIKKYFESIDDDYLIWATEDSFLTKPVNFPIYNELLKMRLPNVGRIGLTNDPPSVWQVNNKPKYNVIQKHKDFNIIEAQQKTNFRISGTWSIWNRKYLISHLNDVDPWQFEVVGSKNAIDDGYRILGTTKNWAVHSCCAIRSTGNEARKFGMDIPDGSKEKRLKALSSPLNFKTINEKTGSLDSGIIKEMVELELITKEQTLIQKGRI